MSIEVWEAPKAFDKTEGEDEKAGIPACEGSSLSLSKRIVEFRPLATKFLKLVRTDAGRMVGRLGAIIRGYDPSETYGKQSSEPASSGKNPVARRWLSHYRRPYCSRSHNPPIGRSCLFSR